MNANAVEVQGLSKKFCRRLTTGIRYSAEDVLRDVLGRSSRSSVLRPEEFWALSDVSFTLAPGESLGLVGANGAGKSTLLKILNGIVRPDRGKVRIHGRVGALIEVGAGFHPLLSGRENVYLNGAILGMSGKQVDQRLESILDFSGLDGRLLESPVRTYSSGQYVRLGFSVAVHSEPDILLVDEVLAVGDIAFVGKCRARIQEMQRSGTSIILVTHSISQMEVTCNRGICLSQGRIVMDGTAKEAGTMYRHLLLGNPADATRESEHPQSDHPDVAFEQFHIMDGDLPTTDVRQGRTYRISIRLRTARPIEKGHLTLWFVREEDELITAEGAVFAPRDVARLNAGQYYVDFECQVSPGRYMFGVSVLDDGVVMAESLIRGVHVEEGPYYPGRCVAAMVLPIRRVEHPSGELALQEAGR